MVIFKKTLLFIFSSLLLASISILALEKFSSPREQIEFEDPYHQNRTLLEAQDYAVVAGTPWATEVAMNVLEEGGNAVDAAVAGVLMLNVTFGEAASFPGVAPVMYYDAKTQEVRSYVGAGTAPAKATIELFKDRGYEQVPDLHILAQLVPASPDVLIRLLQAYGTKSFSELVAPAMKKAREGFPVHHTMAKNMNLSLIERLGYTFMLPTSADVYFGKRWWLPLSKKDRFTRPKLAETFEALAQAEQEALANGKNRENALEAVRNYFYKGPIAEAISNFHEKKNGLIRKEDLANYRSSWEKPLQGSFNEYNIYVNGTWSQGIVIPMVLQILEGIDLKSLGHNSAEYVHTLTQAIDLTMSDREAYIADTAFSKVPLDILLSKEYAKSRRFDIQSAPFSEMPSPGKISGFRQPATYNQFPKSYSPLLSSNKNMMNVGDDTSQIVVVDKEGNAIAITPSDFPKSPMIPQTGLTLGTRMTQFSLDPNHTNRLEPGKRPRITPHAAIVFRNGEFFMAFNTPGGDMQTQALIQVFLNMTVFDMDIQAAIDAPRLKSKNFPSSFDPTDYSPGLLTLEKSLYAQVAEELLKRNYQIRESSDWNNAFSAVGAIMKKDGVIYAGSDPRESGVASGQ